MTYDEQCDECQGLSVSVHADAHNPSIWNYSCRECGAEWIDTPFGDSYGNQFG